MVEVPKRHSYKYPLEHLGNEESGLYIFNSLLRAAKTNGLLDPVSIVLLLLTCPNFVSQSRAGLPLQAEKCYVKKGLDVYRF